MRPVVRIPANSPKRANGEKARARKETRLPPIWLLANLCILLVAGLAVLPHVIQVDAAAGCDWYTVRPGDTLGNLGWAHNTNAVTIAKANQIANPNLIYVGQRLCIPLTQSAHAPTAPTVPATT
jgi:nucleoid-associated protein YgaU